jgi:tetratricopeptide (TPR) repeat protein
VKKQEFPPPQAGPKKILPGRKLLVFVFVTGLALSVVLSVALLFLGVTGLRPSRATEKQAAERDSDSFYKALGDFDREALSPARLGQADALLAELEKKALGVESQLSVLKRRRRLAGQFPEYTENYLAAALRAQENFPYSEPLALAASEALLLAAEAKNAGQDPELSARLGALAEKLSAGSQALAALALRVLAGECADVRSVAAMHEGERLFAIAASETQGAEHQLLTINSAVLRIHNGNIPGALAQIESLLTEGENSEATLKTIAGLLYDYGEALRAAAILAPFTDPQSIAREADALYLGGNIDGAKNLWKLLLSPGDEVPQLIRERALYNLGVLETDTRTARGYLEELFRTRPGNINGVIRYSRFLPAPEAVALLEGLGPENSGNADFYPGDPRQGNSSSGDFRLGLEILKRKRDLVQAARLAAETWIFINKYPQEPIAYEWGAFYFGLQRFYDETAILLKNAAFNKIESPALSLHETLLLALNGSMEDSEERLRDMAKTGSAGWRVYANLGRLREARRKPQEALAYYEAALSLQHDPAEGARLELCAARIYAALGKTQEARNSLQRAAELDPDNLSIQVEIHRLQDILGY